MDVVAVGEDAQKFRAGSGHEVKAWSTAEFRLHASAVM